MAFWRSKSWDSRFYWRWRFTRSAGRLGVAAWPCLQRESAELRASEPSHSCSEKSPNERAGSGRPWPWLNKPLNSRSKLAALGEMSAAVSHELNQPLAAMKTYLAGARSFAAPKPARRGDLSVVWPDRRSDRADGRDHTPAEILCTQGAATPLSPVNMGDALASSPVDDGAAIASAPKVLASIADSCRR